MRSTIEIRLSLNDEEWSNVAMSAFRANKPLHEWIKNQILAIAIAEQREARAADAELEVRAPEPELVRLRDDAVHARETPAPAATTPALPRLAPEPEPRRKPSEIAENIIPKGFEDIVRLGERIVAAQVQAQRQAAGAKKGVRYNRAMGDFYFKQGLTDLPITVRSQLMEIGRRANEIRHWYQTVRPGTVPENVRPYALLKIIERNPAPKRPAKTLHFSDSGIKEVPIEDAFAKPSENATSPQPEPASAPEAPTYQSFDQVDLNNLGDDDSRSVRRFTERVINLGGPKDIKQADLALAIRNIRGKDRSDTPKIARDLVRLGVLAGSSGDFRIRREYADRFTDVVTWATQH